MVISGYDLGKVIAQRYGEKWKPELLEELVF